MNRRITSLRTLSFLALCGLAIESGCTEAADEPTTMLPFTGSMAGAAAGGVGGTAGTDGVIGGASGAAGVSGGASGASASDPSGSMPCEVSTIVANRCGGCHGAALVGGAPISLVTVADFQRDYTVQTSTGLTGQAMKMYELAKIRVNREQGTTPMPQGTELPVEELTALTTWLSAGAPAGQACVPQAGAGGAGGVGAGGAGGDSVGGPSDGECDTSAAQVPLEARDGETCWEFPVHNENGVNDTTKFQIGQGENYNQFYYAFPWPEGHVVTRFGARFDQVPVLHHWLAFDSADTTAPGTVSRYVTGTTNGTDARLIGGWAVGGCNVEMPPDMGLAVSGPSSGRKLMIQWHHYNSTGANVEDGSAVQICTMPAEMKPNKVGMTWLGTENLHANGIFGGMPPGVTSELGGTCLNETSEPITIIAFWPHMHELGVNMKSEIIRQGGTTDLVFDKPFDFNYQIHYNMAPYAVLQPGDRIKSTCTFNNTTSGAVGFGESTKEEMCYQFAFSYPAGALDKPENLSLIGATNTCWGD